MTNTTAHAELEHLTVSDHFDGPAPPPPGESTMPTEIAGKALLGAFAGILGAVLAVAALWMPIAGGDATIALCMIPQAALLVIFFVGYITGLYLLADGPAPGATR
jgi:predicted phage tail protein